MIPDMDKRNVAIGLAGARVMTSGIWGSPTFTPGSFRNVNSLVEMLRAKSDVVSSFLNEQMGSATKERVNSYQPGSGDSNKLRVILADHLNRIISGDSVCDIPGFQTIRLKPETEKLRSQKPQGRGLIELNRLILEEVYYQELWWSRSWQPNAELCHPCHNLHIDRFEIIHDTKFANVATEMANQISFVSPSTVVRYHTIDWEDPWDFEKVYLALDDWVDGYPFDVDHERYLVHMVKGSFVQQICMFALAESRHIPGILVHNSPPEETTPHGKASLVDLDLGRYDRIAARFQSRQKDAVSVLKQGIETHNARFNELISEIERVAVNTSAPILLLGPTGAGKSELASRIYNLRKERKLVTGGFPSLNCGIIRGEAAKSELFGHVPGAYTGATHKRDGALLKAHKGVLFLDEIGALGIEEQALLLRALDTKRFRPYGSDDEQSSDFQLISATNQDLDKAVQTGAFREDLLARIQLWRYVLPGLKERTEDIAPNLDYELKRWTQENGKRVRMSKEVRAGFLRFATSPEAKWTAKFRDLRGIVERMATLADQGIITLAVLATEIDRIKQKWAREDESGEGIDAMLRSLLGAERFAKLDLIDRIQLSGVIHVCRESRTAPEAGRKLYAATRHAKSNDSDRVVKYLNQFALRFSDCTDVSSGNA